MSNNSKDNSKNIFQNNLRASGSLNHANSKVVQDSSKSNPSPKIILNSEQIVQKQVISNNLDAYPPAELNPLKNPQAK